MLEECYSGRMPMTIQQIEEKAVAIRESVIRMLVEAGSGHAAGSLGLADVFASLYFGDLTCDPKNPWWEDRDRVILSNGHVCPVWYATLAEMGYFPKTLVLQLRKLGSKLQGHPIARSAPGIENTSGSLGQGISYACGLALAAHLAEKKHHIFCVMGDGEQQEGQVWEAYWFATTHRLTNLTVIVDRNTIQSEDYTERVLPLEPFAQKLEAFGWYALEVDGHNIEALIDAYRFARSHTAQPVAIIANTIPGKGVDFMEGDVRWHAKAPSPQQACEALQELHTLQGKIHHE